MFEIPKSFSCIMAPPRMAKYVEYSAEIYAIYLRYFSKDGIHAYSIDEAFMDVTGYLPLYGCTARELDERIRDEILHDVGIPATCGIGPNLYLVISKCTISSWLLAIARPNSCVNCEDMAK